MAATTRPLGANAAKAAEERRVPTEGYPREAAEIRFAGLAVASSDWSCARCEKWH
jgi:hypothetical protein